MPMDSTDKKDAKVDNSGDVALSRRDLIKIAGLGLTALAGTNLLGISTCTQAFAMSDKEAEAAQGPPEGFAPKPNKPQYVLKIGRQELNPDHAKPTAAITANGALPAPEIRVKEGEYLRIQVENRLSKQDTSIHWHGILVPAGNGRRPAHLPGANSSGSDIHLRISRSPKRDLLVPLPLWFSRANGVRRAIYHRTQKRTPPI